MFNLNKAPPPLLSPNNHHGSRIMKIEFFRFNRNGHLRTINFLKTSFMMGSIKFYFL